MKKILGLCLLLISNTIWASSPINMACVTEFPTTSFVAFTEGEELTIRVIHHNGVKFMPIWNGIITPNDLPTITEAANALYDLGNLLEFKIPVSDCEKMDGTLMNCFSSRPATEINGHLVRLWSVYTLESVEKSFAGEFAWTYTSVGLDVDGKSFYIPMRYASGECFQSLNSSGLKAKALNKKLILK